MITHSIPLDLMRNLSSLNRRHCCGRSCRPDTSCRLPARPCRATTSWVRICLGFRILFCARTVQCIRMLGVRADAAGKSKNKEHHECYGPEPQHYGLASICASSKLAPGHTRYCNSLARLPCTTLHRVEALVLASQSETMCCAVQRRGRRRWVSCRMGRRRRRS